MEKRYRELDSLRGIASLTVVFHHCLLVFPVFYAAHFHMFIDSNIAKILTNSPLHIAWSGHEAVILFFLLSGFVLSLPFFNKAPNYRSYTIKRFFRIYLPYITISLLSGLILSVYGVHPINHVSNWFNWMWSYPVSRKTVLSFIFMLGFDVHNINTVTWSLIHEMRISLFFPFIMILVTRYTWKKSLFIGLSISLLSWVLSLYIIPHINNSNLALLSASFSDTLYYSSFFVIGAVFAKQRNHLKNIYNTLTFKSKSIIFCLAIFLYTSEWNLPFLGSHKYDAQLKYILPVSSLVDLLITVGVLLLFFLTLNSSTLQHFLTKRLFLILGKISYSLYLIHPIVLLGMVHFLNGVLPLKVIIICVPIVSVLLATVLYRYVEKPSISLGRKFTLKYK